MLDKKQMYKVLDYADESKLIIKLHRLLYINKIMTGQYGITN